MARRATGPFAPLLVIAGAGSGKTNTLAHRVAHLIVGGADPRRILLMTFSRRAASEMTARVERIARKVLGDKAGAMTDALAWAGTFHGIGARLLREYAEQIGLDPAFTIHDREDSADLMNLIRHEKGFSKTKERFPTKGTCLAIYSRCVNAETSIEEVLGTAFPWCAGWAAELKELFAAYVEAKQRQNVLDYDDLLLYWAQTMSDPALAADIGGRFDHVLVDEYQDTNRLQSSILLALKPDGRWPHRGRRRCAIDLFVPRRHRAQHPRFPAAILAAGRHHHARSQLPLDAGDPCGRQWRDRAGARALHQEPVDRPRLRSKTSAGHRARRSRPGPLHRRTRAGESGVRHAVEAAGGAVPHLQPQRPAGSRTDPPQHPVRQVRRPKIPRCRPCQGHAGAVALCRESARPRRRLSADAFDPGRRPDVGAAGARSYRRQRRPDRRACRRAVPAACRRGLEDVCRGRRRHPPFKLAGRSRTRPALV